MVWMLNYQALILQLPTDLVRANMEIRQDMATVAVLSARYYRPKRSNDRKDES